MIQPSNGRIVWFTPGPDFIGARRDPKVPLAAMICHVWNDRCVNLDVVDSRGNHHSQVSVPLLQDDDPKPIEGFFASWMPFQEGQAAKTEQLEKALTGAQIGRLAGAPGAFKREIVDHCVNPANQKIRIFVFDYPGDGGACHEYAVVLPDGRSTAIHFQKGPILQAGINGLTHEVLLAIVADRLRSFQVGPYSCFENIEALRAVTAAMQWLNARTRRRYRRDLDALPSSSSPAAGAAAPATSTGQSKAATRW